MLVELKHHYGWKAYEVASSDEHEAVIEANRKAFVFLTDDNHTVKVVGDRIETYRHNNPPDPQFTPKIYDFGPNGWWFTTEFRIPRARS